MEAYDTAQKRRPTGLMVGLNRRFSPMISEVKKHLPVGAPKHMIYRVNAGPILTSSWLHDPAEGAGMLVGEMCHFVDLMQFVAEEKPETVYARSLKLNRRDLADEDNLSITVAFSSGSIGTLCYSTGGDKAVSKERLEIYSGGVVAIVDDFRHLEVTKNGSTTRQKLRNQDKGQVAQIAATVKWFREMGTSPIPFDELVSTMQVIFAVKRSLASGAAVSIAPHIPKNVEV